jgi:hypothetical protein
MLQIELFGDDAQAAGELLIRPAPQPAGTENVYSFYHHRRMLKLASH